MMDSSRLKSRMPVLFIGHGNQMYGIEENRFTRGWRSSVEGLPTPDAIVVVSAHWETDGTMVTSMEHPRTIHDFYGFPEELFNVIYPAPGHPELAHKISQRIEGIALDSAWGLDHGTWSILRQMFPASDIPVIQISLDRRKSAREHYDFAKQLRWLRDEGVLFIGSGNIVHNLGRIDFRAYESHAWAQIAEDELKGLISSREIDKLVSFETLTEEVKIAIPTPEHFLPLLYSLAMSQEGDSLKIFNEGIDLASISMTSFKWEVAN